MEPRVFVGSASESLEVANALQEALDHDAQVIVWPDGVFDLSKTALDSLLSKLDDFDFAIFVFTPDDITNIRGQNYSTARDNVMIELGLFVGRLGRERCFIVHPRGVSNFHMPTDLLGLIWADYVPGRIANYPVAAVKSACNRIIRAMRTAGRKPRNEIRTWDFENIYEAPGHLLREIGESSEITRCRIVAYTCKIAANFIALLRTASRPITELRVLARHPEHVAAASHEPGAIPSTPSRISDRLGQIRTSVMEDLMLRDDRTNIVANPYAPRFYKGQPTLRGIVLDTLRDNTSRQHGFLSLYVPSGNPEHIDWHASTSAALRLSQDGGFEEKLLVDFVRWFDQLWEHGSVELMPEELKEILDDLQ